MSIADQSCAQAVQKSKKAHKSKRNNKAVSEKKSLHRFVSIPLNKVNSAKSDSDFAAVEFCCRGRRPRRPVRRAAKFGFITNLCRRAV